MAADDAGADLGFTYSRRKNGDVVISRSGRVVTTLRGAPAMAFAAEVETASDADAQQLLARLTGNYKRGNERVSRRHPRNRE